MLNEKPAEQGRMAARDDQPGSTERKRSAARVQAFRQRRRAAGKRLVGLYLSDQESARLNELAHFYNRSPATIVGAWVNEVWQRAIGNKPARCS